MSQRRPQIQWWSTLIIALGFATILLPVLTADRLIHSLGGGKIAAGQPAPITVRVPPFAGIETPDAGRIGGGGGVVIARGDSATRDDEYKAAEIELASPSAPTPFVVMFVLAAVFAGLYSYHARRSTLGRLVRTQLVNLALVLVLAAAVKATMLVTPSNVLVVPVALFALVPTLVLDRVVGLATGILAALIVALCVPFDFGVSILLLVQVTAAGLVVAERPKRRLASLVRAGVVATLLTALAYPLLIVLTSGRLPFAELSEPLRSTWLAATAAPLIATVIALAFVPLYQWLTGEITQHKLIELEDFSQPLLKQISEKAPGTWQHSLMMANMAEIAANAIGANGRLVRVGAYYHDLGKSLEPKYFIENLEPGETSPHDKLPPEASRDAIFGHVAQGVVTARKSGLHERIVDFMIMHHGNGVLEYFWGKCQEQGNPKGLTVEYFRYPGVPPQTRETAILAICDAVEAASRTLKKNDIAAIDSLVQRIVYGKLHLGQLDDSGLSMADLRKLTDSLRETIKHANHNRIEYPWQKAEHSASAMQIAAGISAPLDSLDRPTTPDAIRAAAAKSDPPPVADEAIAETVGVRKRADGPLTGPQKPLDNELANSATAPIPLLEKQMRGTPDPDIAITGRVARDSNPDIAGGAPLERSSRDSRREADRSAMAARYAGEPASRDSSGNTATFELDEQIDNIKEPPTPGNDDIMSSRDGSRRIPLSQPSDGDGGEVRSRSNKRTNDTGNRNRAGGDFVAQMVLQPLKDGTPTSLSDVDTGRHTSVPQKDSTKEIDQFAAEATRALRAAAPDLDVLPPDQAPARKRAATIPPTPELVRPRAPTVPPPARPITVAPPFEAPERASAKTLFGGAADLRPPAKREQTGPQPLLGKADTRTNPAVPRGIDLDLSRDEAARNRDDAATTQPAMPAIKASDLAEVDEYSRRRADAAVTRPVPKQDPEPTHDEKTRSDDSATTQPAMPRALDGEPDPTDSSDDASIGDDTQVGLVLPLPAPVFSDPAILLDTLKESAATPQSTWARSLAAKLDAGMDDEFGRDTPTRAPSRAELQALVDTPPDATRQQSVEEIELLAQHPAARRSEEELQFTPRRSPYPTAEVREEDIEAAIEIAPSARRTGSIPIGIAKPKKPPTE